MLSVHPGMSALWPERSLRRTLDAALMPKNPLFSTYRQGENRVTASMLAVFERIGLDLLEQLLASASGESSLSFVEFTNQVGGPATVPDASIRGSFHYLFEVKTERDALRFAQLKGHLQMLDGRAIDERLFVVTPDSSEPPVIGEIPDGRILWASFLSLAQAIDEIIGDPSQLVSDQERFLLRELQALFDVDGLLSTDDVVVVAARDGYAEYLATSAYICQPERTFRNGVERMGFYADGAIQREVPRILGHVLDVEFSPERIAELRKSDIEDERKAGDLAERCLLEGIRPPGIRNAIYLLSAHDDEETLHLQQVVENTSRKNGRGVAWTQYQRYTRSDALQCAKTTDDLITR
jgi:hypothetical protein